METRENREQERYARWLWWGAHLGLSLLIAGFAVYVFALVPPHVPHERLPYLWSLSAAEYLRQAGIPAGWGWASLAGRGDLGNLVGIAVLASCSIPCLAAVMPLYRERGERVYFWICALEIAVLALAASGVLVAGH